MNSSTELPPELPEQPPSESDFHLTQVDPPHPWKSAWKTLLVSAVVLIAAVAIFYFIVKKPPQMTGAIVQVNYYPVHSAINGGGGAEGMQGGVESYDQLLVLAVVKVHNQTNIPLFLEDISATLTTADGAGHENDAANASDVDRVFQAFPALAPYRSQLFDRTATIQPGQSTQGLAIFNFPVTRQQWDARKSGNVVVSFLHQNNLLISFPH